MELTQKQITAEPAGPTLDAWLVNELGWSYHSSSFEQVEPSEWRYNGKVVWRGVFKPSTDIAAVWPILLIAADKRKDGFTRAGYSLREVVRRTEAGDYRTETECCIGFCRAFGLLAPEAISKALLLRCLPNAPRS